MCFNTELDSRLLSIRIQMSQRYLPINEIFETIQGEGYYTGVPAIFIRLQGCDVGCSWCDTKHTWGFEPSQQCEFGEIIGVSGDKPRWANASVENLVAQLQTYSATHVVLTGGEPCIYDLRDLCERLLQRSYTVQVETSGTYPILVSSKAWVTVSPKVAMQGGKPILEQALLRADEIKHPVAREKDIENLHELLSGVSGDKDLTICLQPISQQARATQLCIQTCIKNNWRLSLQTHKYLGID